MRETRNSAGIITAQYFNFGETISGTGYVWTKDHLGSVKEMTDSSGNIQAAYSYDSYGKESKTQGSLFSDFQYAGYYYHAPSGLSLTRNRAYSAVIGRWINRDPVQEKGGVNLFRYALNDPLSFIDPSGLQQSGTGNSGSAGPGSAVPGPGGGGKVLVPGHVEDNEGMPTTDPAPPPCTEPCVQGDSSNYTIDMRAGGGEIAHNTNWIDNHGVLRTPDGQRICGPGEVPKPPPTYQRPPVAA